MEVLYIGSNLLYYYAILVLIFLEYADVVYVHLLREYGSSIGISGPITTYGYVENKEELLIEWINSTGVCGC